MTPMARNIGTDNIYLSPLTSFHEGDETKEDNNYSNQ